MLLRVEYGLDVEDDENLGNTRFELTVIGANDQRSPISSGSTGSPARAPVGGVEMPTGGIPTTIEGHAERVEANVHEASIAMRNRQAGHVHTGSEDSSSSLSASSRISAQEDGAKL